MVHTSDTTPTTTPQFVATTQVLITQDNHSSGKTTDVLLTRRSQKR